MHRRGPDAIQPRAPVLGARCGEWSAGDLLGIKTMRRPLRCILPDRQRAGHGLCRVFVCKAGQVPELIFRHSHSRRMITFSSVMKLLMRPMKRAPSACKALASGEAFARSIAA